MKKNFLFSFLLISILPGFLNASSLDSISTVYKNGEFVSYCQIWVNAGDSSTNEVFKEFNFQMENDFDKLFQWAFIGLKLQGESNNFMLVNYTSSTYNNETQIMRFVGEVVIPSIITVPNIITDCKISKKQTKNSKTEVNIQLVYSNTFLKTMTGRFEAKPSVNKSGSWYIMEVHSSFGWFFDLFITKEKYREIVEWRLKRFVINLKNEAERLNSTNQQTKKTIR